MTNYTIYKLLEGLIDKETNGGFIDPKTYNYFAPVANMNLFKRLIKELYGKADEGQSLSETHFSSKLIRPLLVTETVAPSVGVITISSLSSSYAYWGKMLTTAVYNGQIRKIELLPHDEVEHRLHNILAKPVSRNPIAEINGATIKTYPTNIPNVTFTYIKYPDTPIFDYYVDANKQIQYLTEGQSAYTLLTDEIYSDGTTSGSVTSTTIELDYDEDYHPEFVIEMAKLLSNREENQLREQYARIEQQIQDND